MFRLATDSCSAFARNSWWGRRRHRALTLGPFSTRSYGPGADSCCVMVRFFFFVSLQFATPRPSPTLCCQPASKNTPRILGANISPSVAGTRRGGHPGPVGSCTGAKYLQAFRVPLSRIRKPQSSQANTGTGTYVWLPPSKRHCSGTLRLPSPH